MFNIPLCFSFPQLRNRNKLSVYSKEPDNIKHLLMFSGRTFVDNFERSLRERLSELWEHFLLRKQLNFLMKFRYF